MMKKTVAVALALTLNAGAYAAAAADYRGGVEMHFLNKELCKSQANTILSALKLRRNGVSKEELLMRIEERGAPIDEHPAVDWAYQRRSGADPLESALRYYTQCRRN